MGNLTVVALRVIMTVVLAGTAFFQVLFVTLLFTDPDPAPVSVRAPLIAVMVLGMATIQVTTVAVWRLLTMVKRGKIFSHSAFRHVDVIIGAVSAASVLAFTFGVLLATLPFFDDLAPGIVLMIGGGGVILAGIALLVIVLKMLLAQAISRDTEAENLRSELKDVI